MKPYGKSYNKLSAQEKEQIIELFLCGFSYKEITNKLGTTNRAVPKVIREYDMQTPRKNRYTLNEHYFDVIDSAQKAYWLGIIASDGCITETNYFAISMNDRDVIEQLKDDISYTGSIYSPKHKDDGYNRKQSYRINFSSKILCDALRSLGIYEKSHYHLTICQI